MTRFPEVPYNGSSGWSGSETSRKRAERDDTNGVTAQRQIDTMNAIEKAGQAGLTWRELAFHYGWHHGQASGALSNLHKTGNIDRLKETREKCHVYVLPEWVLFRDTEPFGRKQNAHPHEVIEVDLTQTAQLRIFETADGGQILIEQYWSGKMKVATRPDNFSTWSAPLECVHVEELL
jgi:hypothetical protein